ncbi:hypothetical protein LTR26_009478 [Exophiala xenobiotica]|nr:hypothetical protein LTR26_009478 [Exophiala xenobiotica]
MGNEAVYNDNFLFINKGVKDIGVRNQNQDFAVRSHVNRPYRRWQRRLRDKALKLNGAFPRRWPQTSSSPFGTLTPRPNLPLQSERVSARQQPGTCARQSTTSTWRAGPAPAYRERLQEAQPTRHIRGHTPGLSPPFTEPDPLQPRGPTRDPSVQPLSLLGNGSSDPFSAAALPITALHHELIRFWEYRFYMALCPPGQSPRFAITANSMWLAEIRGAVADRTQLHAIFASALTYMLRTMPPSQDKRKASSMTYEHRVACLSSLRSLMAHEQSMLDLGTLRAIYLAAMMHFFAGEVEECDLHAKAMFSIVSRLGGLGSLDQTLALRLVILDTMLAHGLLQRPRFSTSEWNPGPWSKQTFVTPFGFSSSLHFEDYMLQNSPIHPDIPSGLRPYLKGHREVLCAGHLARRLRHPSTQAAQTSAMLSDGIQQWILVRRYAVSAHCISLYHDLPEWKSCQSPGEEEGKPHVDVNVDLQQSLCLAIEYCQRVIFLCAWEKVAVYIPFHHLRTSLTRVLRGLKEDTAASGLGLEEHGEALFFLFFVGAVGEELALVDFDSGKTNTNTNTTTVATATETSAAGLLSDRWFSKHMAIVAVKIGCVEFDATKALLSRFLYDAIALDRTLEALIAGRG